MGQKNDSKEAWDAFWDSDQAAAKRCLPDAARGIDGVQNQVWSRVAAELPQGARVLDLGTGGGRVMAALLAARGDLQPIGIDHASALPPPPHGSEILTGVELQDLPFADESFPAVTSQFGFEYGDPQPCAREVARVLEPEGKLSLITHREDSVIVEHNLARLEAIRWVLEDQDLPGVAVESLRSAPEVPAEVAQAPAEGARRFGPQSAAWEIAEAIRRTMQFGRNDPAERTASVIGQIAAQAKGEMLRLVSMKAAAGNAGTGEKLAGALEAAGLQVHTLEPLYDGYVEQPFASFIALTKPE